MTVKIYKTKNDQIYNTPIIYNNVIKVVDQTNDDEIDIFIKSTETMARWEYIENVSNYWLIIFTD